MKKRNLFKLAALTAVFALGSMFTNAQNVTGPNLTVQSNATLGGTGGSVKVIDNKGTVKYIQTANGLTTFTNTAPSGGVVTTFQLGGELTDSTYINTLGKRFGFKGLTQAADGTGLQLVVIDGNGAIQRMDFDDLIVTGHEKFTVTGSDPIIAASYTFTASVNLPAFKQVYIYRNGAKLLATEDYVVVTGAGNEAKFQIVSANLTLYSGDVIELHFIK